MKSCRRVVFVAAVCLWIASLSVKGQSVSKEGTNEWARAEAAITEHLKRIDLNMRSAEFKSNLLRKHLPDLRLFVRFDRHLIGETRLFFVNKGGDVTALPEEEWRGNVDDQCFRVARVVEFLKRRKMPVQNADEALEFAKLFEEIQGAANYVSFLNINTRNFTVFDKAFIEGQFGPRTHWKYSAAARTNGWSVKVEYVGPPASIMQPPTYEIDVDDQKLFRDLRRYPYPKDSFPTRLRRAGQGAP